MEAAWKNVETPEFVEYEAWDPSELGFDVPKEEKDKPLPETQEADEIPDYDRHIATKVSIPKDGHTFATGRVVKRSRDENGVLEKVTPIHCWTLPCMRWSLKMVQLKGTMPTSLLHTSVHRLMVKATPRHCWMRS